MTTVSSIVEGRKNDITEAVKRALENGAFPLFQRIVVTDVLVNPAALNDAEISEISSRVNTMDLRRLPRNTVIGRRVKHSGVVVFSSYQIFFPLFPPHFSLPIKPGEHAWVMYESIDQQQDVGFWVCRITDLRDVDDVNYTHADRKFFTTEEDPDEFGGKLGFPNGVPDDPSTQSLQTNDEDPNKVYEDLVSHAAEKLHPFEPVPRYTKRIGDNVLQGSNNTLISLGTERKGPAYKVDDKGDDGTDLTKPEEELDVGQGAIDIVVGRGQSDLTKSKEIETTVGHKETDKRLMSEKGAESEGDVDFETDMGRIYLSMAARPDVDFNLSLPTAKLVTTDDENNERRPTGVIKADSVRIVARKDIRMMVKASKDVPDDQAAAVVIKADGNIVFIPAAKGLLLLGGEDADKAVLCTKVVQSKTDGTVFASPIIDSMGGAQGGEDGLNGIFAEKVLLK